MPTVTGLEDETNPVYAVENTSEFDSRVRSASLDAVRDATASRKAGYWKPGTGRSFMPERWLDDQGRFDINAGPSLPFSIGQRSCFGKNLAVSRWQRPPYSPAKRSFSSSDYSSFG